MKFESIADSRFSMSWEKSTFTLDLSIHFHIPNRSLCVLSYEVASGSDIIPCNKIDKPQWFTDFVNKMKAVHDNALYVWHNPDVFTQKMQIKNYLNII